MIDVDFIGLETTHKSDAASVKTSVQRAVESGLGEKTTVFNKKFVAIGVMSISDTPSTQRNAAIQGLLDYYSSTWQDGDFPIVTWNVHG